MLLGIKNDAGQSDRVVLGYDLDDFNAQISYCPLNSYDAETVSSVMGNQIYDIPTVLCKRLEVNQWYYGREALRQAEAGAGTLVEGLFEKARKGIPVVVEDEEYDPVLLLSLFVKKSISILSAVVPLSKIAGVMFTTNTIDEQTVKIFNTIVEGLALKTKRIYFQSHVESLYYYTIHQPKDVWNGQVLACEYEKDMMITHRLEFNRNTTPIVAFSETECFNNIEIGNKDRNFLNILHKNCDGRYVSSIQLIGNGYKEEWYKDSLKYMCVNRRVFAGNNLYSKGACYGILEKLSPSDVGKEYIYLGKDKLKTNIGMEVLKRGQTSYLALLDAGVNWYESKAEAEVIMQEDNVLQFKISSLIGNKVYMETMVLNELAERKKGTNRVRLQIEMVSDNKAYVVVEDLGFGEFYASTNQVWEKEILLDNQE
ncbi:MAG: hypothetical protein IKJ15_00330 [Lachnospiraceae bacterium]|nr:hypothetical protein [Lachnospiraceae bacterium]